MPHKPITTKSGSCSLSTLYARQEETVASHYDSILDLINAEDNIDNKDLELEATEEAQMSKQLLHHIEIAKTKSYQLLTQINSTIATNVQACIDIGLNLSKLEQPTSARMFYELSLAFVSQDAKGCFYIGLDLFNSGDKNAARIFYEQVTKLEAFDAETYFNKGFSLSALGMHMEAIYFYDLAITLNPNEPDAYVHKSAALSALGYYEEAIRQCDKAIKIGVSDPEAYHCKNEALIQLGRFDEARYCLQLADELELDSSITNNNVDCESYYTPILGESEVID